MAVRDLWHKRGDVAPCPECGQKAGPPSARHGRGLRWRVDVPGHPTESFARKGQAERREVALWNTPRPTVTGERVEDMVRLWRASKNDLAPATQRAAKEASVVVNARWHGVKLDAVDHDDVQAWISNLTTTKGPASTSQRQKALQCLRGALAIAVRRKLIPANPADDVTVPEIEAREGRFLSLDELDRLADAANAHARELGLKAKPGQMIWFMATAGTRIGETCALDVGNIDPIRKRARVIKGKGGKSRNVPLTTFALARLDLDRDPAEPLFPAPRAGGRQEPTYWRRRWFAPAVEAAGLGDVVPHDLRHTAVSLAIHAGASIYDVQQMCGHSKPSTTMNIYGHLLDGHLDDVANRMDAILGTVPGTVSRDKA